MPKEAAHRGHRQRDTDRKDQKVGEPKTRRSGSGGQDREDRGRASKAMQRADHQRAVIMVMRARFVMRMPMRMGREAFMLMKMKMPAAANQVHQNVGAQQDHCAPHRTLRHRGPMRRQRAAETKKDAPNEPEHEAMTKGPTESRTHALTGTLLPRREDRQRHHMICIEGVEQSQAKCEHEPR